MNQYIYLADSSPVTLQKKRKKKKVLLLADSNNQTKTVIDYIHNIKLYSTNDITIINPISDASHASDFLDSFDCIIIHYSIHIANYYFLSECWQDKIINFKKKKILILQDEYRHIDLMHHQIKKLGIHTLISSLSIENMKIVYPKKKFPNIQFLAALPGYVTQELLSISKQKKIKKTIEIFGRGSELSIALGDLREEKNFIYNDVKKLLSKDFRTDISDKYIDRIYKDNWFDCLRKSKLLLSTQGGSSLFDFDGSLEKLLLTFPEVNKFTSLAIRKKYELLNNNLNHRTITPRIFEAIGCDTGLLLLEGDYRGVIKPDIHYIEIKSDLSNWDDVKSKIIDLKFINYLKKNCVRDVLNNEFFSYKFFVKNIDVHIV